MNKEIKYKPYQVMLFILSIFVVFTTLSLFVPEKGWNIGGVNVRFLSWNKVLHPKKQTKKDITKVVTNVDTTSLDADPLIQHQNGSDGNMGAPTGGALSIESATTIHFNDLGKEKLYKLFARMKSLAENKDKISVLHYGDSQIEGDRMTAYIRQRLQNQFGGNGPGLVAANNVYNTQSFKQFFSSNFVRYTCFGPPKLKNRKYGVMGSAARFTAEMDSTLAKSTTEQEAWIEIAPSPSAYSRARAYNNVKMFYTSCVRPCKLTVYQNNKIIHEDSLITDGKHHVVSLSFPNTPGKLKYVFKSTVSPTISNFSLEGDYGIQVGNIAMRGSSGKIFGYMDQMVLGNTYSELDAELFIMQFGGNSVPFFRDSAGVRAYARDFQKQLKTLQKLRPSATIIVIGPSDMSRNVDGVWETYPFLPYCVQQMKAKCVEMGAGYWDLFNAMGGKDAMPSWVEKGLAGGDYIHFSPRGASIASQLFFDAFSAEYAKWLNQDL